VQTQTYIFSGCRLLSSCSELIKIQLYRVQKWKNTQLQRKYAKQYSTAEECTTKLSLQNRVTDRKRQWLSIDCWNHKFGDDELTVDHRMETNSSLYQIKHTICNSFFLFILDSLVTNPIHSWAGLKEPLITHVANIYANLTEELKENVCIRKEFNCHRTGLGHKHGRHSTVLGHQYGRRDVMWKQSIESLLNKINMPFAAYLLENGL